MFKATVRESDNSNGKCILAEHGRMQNAENEELRDERFAKAKGNAQEACSQYNITCCFFLVLQLK